MTNPRKRKGGAQIGRVLAKGATASEGDFTTAQLENLLEIGQKGHDGDGTGVLGDLRLAGVGDVHDDAPFEHFGEAGFEPGGGGLAVLGIHVQLHSW